MQPKTGCVMILTFEDQLRYYHLYLYRYDKWRKEIWTEKMSLHLRISYKIINSPLVDLKKTIFLQSRIQSVNAFIQIILLKKFGG